MRVALLVAYAVLALVSVQHTAVAQDTDEFEGIESPVTTLTADSPSATDSAPIVQYDVVNDYWLEGGSWALAILYLFNYFGGKSKNKKFVEKWLAEAEPELVKAFAYTGNSAEPAIGLLEESKNNFKYYCTGRRFCSRLVVDFETISRHDLFSRMWKMVIPSHDYVTLDVGLNASDLDPFVLTICKKLQFNDLAKTFPELISIAKRQELNAVPDSFCLAADNVEIPKVALTKQLQTHIAALGPFLEYIVITDVNSVPVLGLPESEKRLLRVRFKMQDGSKQLDGAAAIALLTYLIDAIGSTMKLSRDLKYSAQKKRVKYAAERAALEEQQDDESDRLNILKEKKRKEYESMSYEEQQKYDKLQQKKQLRKRTTRKK